MKGKTLRLTTCAQESGAHPSADRAAGPSSEHHLEAGLRAEAGTRLGGLILLGREGRKWRCQCDCGAIEAYRWVSLSPCASKPIRQCTSCDAKPCRACGELIARRREAYCNDVCKQAARGKQQAEYYRERMRNPELRAKRIAEIRHRRENMSEEKRERRRAQNRLWLSRLSPERRKAQHAYQREWYLRHFNRISAKRRQARLQRTDEQREAAAKYLQMWYQRHLERLYQNPEALREYKRRRRLAFRRWVTRSAMQDMISDVAQLRELVDD